MRVIIYGANEIGCLIATEFFEDHDVTVIDNEENRTDDFNRLDISFIQGNGSNVNVLNNAQIKYSDIFISCTNMDEANIVACLTAKKMNMDIKTVCFIEKQEYIESLESLKDSEYNFELLIDHIIWPEKLLTQEIFSITTVPDALLVENFASGKARMTEYKIKENSYLLNKKVKECDFPQNTLIVGITRNDTLFIPTGETELLLDDKVIFMGFVTSLDILATRFFENIDAIKSVAIIGGGAVGAMLALNFEQANIKVKIVEKDYKRCEFLTDILKKSLVLNADGTNIELLKEEEINASDVIISVTDNDEKNLLCSLLAKQLGAKRIITRVSKSINVTLFEKVGIDVAISPKKAIIDELNNSLFKTDVDILATVEKGQGEIVEFQIPEHFKDKKIMDLKIPTGCVIGIIKRSNKVIIPKGDTLLREKDNIIIFTTSEVSPVVKDYFKKI